MSAEQPAHAKRLHICSPFCYVGDRSCFINASEDKGHDLFYLIPKVSSRRLKIKPPSQYIGQDLIMEAFAL